MTEALTAGEFLSSSGSLCGPELLLIDCVCVSGSLATEMS